jgi:hypothetical protein
MPLDAKVISLEQLLLKYPCLDVPNYQRTFKWNEEKITTTFQDILNGLDFTGQADNRGHFLGSVVVCKDVTNNRTDLVDGQQRLTTLTIMLWSLAKLADKQTIDKAKRVILQSDLQTPRILHKSSNKELCSDRDAYREIATKIEADHSPEEGEPDDENVIQRNADWHKALISTYIYKAGACLDDLAERACDAYLRDTKTTSRSKAAAEIYKRLAEGIRLIIIETDQRKEGMRVFASINAGGTPLETWELIMSAFYTHGPEPKQQSLVELTFENDKHSIAKVLASEDDDAAVNNGLRTFWLATRRFARMDDLFNEFNETLAKSQDPKKTHSDLLKQILFSVPFLKAFDTAPNSIKNAVVEKSYALESVYPLTVAMKDKLARPILLSLLLRLHKDPESADDAVRRVSFALEKARMKLIVCKYGANFIEKPYSQLAVDIYKGKLGDDPETIEDTVYDYLRGIKGFPTKEELESAFQRYTPTGKDQKLPKLIAIRLQEALRNPKKLPFLYLSTPKREVDTFKLTKGLIYDKEPSERDAHNLGFESAAKLLLIGGSLGNLFMADLESGDIDHRIEFNGRKDISELDEQAMTERRDMLAELASRIWNF